MTTSAPERGSTSQPLPCTVEDLAGRLTLPVWSQSGPSLAGLVGLSKSGAYDCLKSEHPAPHERVGNTCVVLTLPLLVWLGLPEDLAAALVLSEPDAGDYAELLSMREARRRAREYAASAGST